MKTAWIMTLGACVLVAGAAFAQPGPHGGPLVGERFNAADTDNDGKLSYEEIKAVRPGMPREAFDRMDKDGDGKLTPAEIAQGMREWRSRRGGEERGDSDARGGRGDGRGGERGEDGGYGSRGPHGPGGPGGHGRPPHMNPRVMLKEADTNGDGKVSLEEFKAHAVKRAEELFKRLDRNGDGYITEDEIPEHGPGAGPGLGRGPHGPGGGPHGGGPRAPHGGQKADN